jgi:hypothetical protein
MITSDPAFGPQRPNSSRGGFWKLIATPQHCDQNRMGEKGYYRYDCRGWTMEIVWFVKVDLKNACRTSPKSKSHFVHLRSFGKFQKNR